MHPLYLTTKELACCDVVDVVGNLWLAMFMAGWFGAALVVAMICYIRRLDELPSKRWGFQSVCFVRGRGLALGW